MNNLGAEELKIILDTGDFEALIGRIENEFFDCKRGIYSLNDDAGKRELAKDISSFANLNGGYLLIGPQTEKSEKYLGDEIKSISYLPEAQINRQQYIDVVREWIYPDIHGLNISWHQSKIDAKKGIFVIHIPHQAETDTPFLITKVLDGKKRVEIVFGYVERKQDSNFARDITSIHSLLRDGINYNRNIDGRLSDIESSLGEIQKKELSVKKREVHKDAQERVRRALGDNKMNQLPNFNLIAYPEEPAALKTIFINSQSSIKHKLEYPPALRPPGWNLETSDRAQIREGKLIRVEIESRKIIDLYESGEIVFCVVATDDFLCWGTTKDIYRFNTLALIESISNFVIFYGEVLKDFTQTIENIYFSFAFNNLWVDNNKYYLVPYTVGTIGYRFSDEKKDAPQASIFSDPILVEINNFRAEVVAYELVSKIFLWFGVTLDKIPYTKKLENGMTGIDFEAIKSIR